MNTKVFWGAVHHRRNERKVHNFSYPLFMLQLDLQALASEQIKSPLLKHNKYGVFSIFDSDYLMCGAKPILEKLHSVLANENITYVDTKSFLLTVPRFLGYVFNPASFFISFNKDETLHSIVAEVNNTFGEKHSYVMQAGFNNKNLPISFSFPKSFFVSPFFDVSGEYRCTLQSLSPKLQIDITLLKSNREVFNSSLRGRYQEFTTKNLIRTLLKFPLTAVTTMIKIHYQAMILYFKHQIVPKKKPVPSSINTLRSRQNIIHSLRLKVLSMLTRFKVADEIRQGDKEDIVFTERRR